MANPQADPRTPTLSSPLKLAVGVATIGRPAILIGMITTIKAQKRPADAIFVCAPSESDVLGLAIAHPDVVVIIGARGLAHQRNAILRETGGFDAVIFLDDDFLASPDYVASVDTVFATRPEIMAITGTVVADGIRGPGYDLPTARALLEIVSKITPSHDISDFYAAYGCNMAIRLDPVRRHGLAFDEMLPSYAWLEDVDFSRRLAAYGRIVKASSARGIHMGAKSGRQSGLRLGYSQIANPIYLLRKGTCSPRKAFRLMSQNVAANAIRSFRPESYVDRPGRLRGNARALIDLLRGRLSPMRILSL